MKQGNMLSKLVGVMRCVIVGNHHRNAAMMELVGERRGNYRPFRDGVVFTVKNKNRNMHQRATKKILCIFMFKVLRNKIMRFYVHVLCGYHNHDEPKSLVRHAPTAKLSIDEFSIMKDYTVQGLRLKIILNAIKEKNPKK